MTSRLNILKLATVILCFVHIQEVITNKQYRGFRLLRAFLENEEDKQDLQRLVNSKKLSVWQRKTFKNSSSLIDVLCSPETCNDFEEKLKEYNISHSIKINDIQDIIDTENNAEVDEEEWENRGGHRLTWQRYHQYSDIESYLNYLEATYPTLCKQEIIGKSSEGRPLKVLSINLGSTKKPTIWIDGGMHGREWISVTSATYALLELVEYQKNHEDLLSQFNWYIMPLVNPDGYEYSRTEDRLWRKSRSSRQTCVGVDLNRNFGFQWRRGSGICGEINPGPFPFSEPETRAMRDFILSHKDKIKAYISLHSYSQMWLLPWGYKDEKPKDYYYMYLPAEDGVAAIKAVRGTDYLQGTGPELIYKTTGSSDDWAKGEAGIDYSYTIELPDTGDYGFMLPSSEIEPVGKETWEGIKAFARALPFNKFKSQLNSKIETPIS